MNQRNKNKNKQKKSIGFFVNFSVKVKYLTHKKTRYNRTILYLKNAVFIALLKIKKKLRK
jgi:hypothetical protein